MDELKKYVGAATDVTQGMQARDRERIDGDRLAWVEAQVRSAVRMAAACQAAQGPRADETMLKHGIDGIIKGASLEIASIFGYAPPEVDTRNWTKQAASKS